MNFVEKPKYENILSAIDDKIQLIDRVNEAIKRHQGDTFQVIQYNELKEIYIKELKELLNLIFAEHDIPIKISA